jgi:TonB family protein
MERMLMEYLMNSLWQAPLLAGGACLVLRTGRPRPRVQHGVWVAALALMVAMPLLSLRGAAEENVVAPAAAPALPEVESAAEAVPVVAPVSDLASGAEDSPRWLRMREMRLSAGTTHRVVEFYLAVVLLAMMRLLWSWMVARRMVVEATAAVLSDAELELLDGCCERLQVRRPRVLVSTKTSSPLVVGVLRPVLLLPERFAEHGERELEAVWWHELAHVRRRDYLANLVCRVWALPVAYHPATYAVERRVRQTREMLCDRMAAEGMHSPVGYARCLVGLAQRMQDGCAAPGQLQGTAMFGNGVLEERVMELIGKKTVESVWMRAMRMACGMAMLAAVVGAAAIFHVTPTMAQEGTAAGVSAVQPVAAAPIQSEVPSQPAVTRKTDTVDAAERARIEKALVDAKRELENAELKTQMTEAQRQARSATLKVDQAELKKQIELLRSLALKKQLETINESELTEQMEKMDSPEFKKQMEDARRQIDDATRLFADASHDGAAQKLGGVALFGLQHVASGTMEGSLIFRPDPVYPPIAKAAHVQGPVVLDAVISKEGTVKDLSVVSGPQMLQLSAINAVEQWKYKPYVVDGSPVEVKTSITVNFTFGDGPAWLTPDAAMQNVVSKVDPVYPADAKAAHVQGAVLLDAVISRTGTVEALGVVSGPALLQLSAIDAVKQWKFKPYLVKGSPTEVRTTITVNFDMGKGLSLFPGAARLVAPSPLRLRLYTPSAIPE